MRNILVLLVLFSASVAFAQDTAWEQLYCRGAACGTSEDWCALDVNGAGACVPAPVAYCHEEPLDSADAAEYVGTNCYRTLEVCDQVRQAHFRAHDRRGGWVFPRLMTCREVRSP
jgi:hypothetical protein